jgi:hypothetical protein
MLTRQSSLQYTLGPLRLSRVFFDRFLSLRFIDQPLEPSFLELRESEGYTHCTKRIRIFPTLASKSNWPSSDLSNVLGGSISAQEASHYWQIGVGQSIFLSLCTVQALE